MGGFGGQFGWQDAVEPALAGFVCSLAACLILVATRRWHGRFTNDDHNGVQKFHRDPTPRIGGVALAAAFLAVWPLLTADLARIWGLIGLAGLPALGFGLAEDLTRQVAVRWRLAATMASGVLLALLTGYMVDAVDLPGVDWLLGFWIVAVIFTGFAVGGVANAVNIIDGFNGLAAGALVIMFGAFAWVAHQVGDGLVAGLALVYAALVLGFLVVNFPFGKLFLGDGGAYFCGYLLATLGVLMPARNPEISAWTAILICAYPVIETLASIARKSRRERSSISRPDRVHFHMLAYRRYARRLIRRGGRVHLRNPATSLVTWLFPLLTAGLVAISYDNVWMSAAFFFLTAYIYIQLYRVMSLNPPRLPPAISRLL
jgi:UDP-N-acetylmuramyl pentapeptide phosphotransferase/UDP-N-acetylglucosamine-1-phosphate transferase